MALLRVNGVAVADLGSASLTWGVVGVERDGADRIVRRQWACQVASSFIGVLSADDAAARAAAFYSLCAAPAARVEFDGFRAIDRGATFGNRIELADGPRWSARPGGNGLTFIEYAAAWTWAIEEVANPLLAFQETVRVSGGLPVIAARRVLNGPPVLQVTVPLTEFRATQTGTAVGLYARPDPQPPVFPLVTGRDVGGTSGRRRGQALSDFARSWAYEFVSVVPLLPTPTEWTN